MSSFLVDFPSPLLKFLLRFYECESLTFWVCLTSAALPFHFVSGLHAYNFVQVELVGEVCELGITDLLPVSSKNVD